MYIVPAISHTGGNTVAPRLALVGTLALSLAVTATAFGQTKGSKGSTGSNGGAQIGPVAGVNIFTFGGSDASGATSRTAFYAGLALRAPLSPTVFVEPQLLYFQVGAKTTVNDPQLGTVEGTFKLSYIEVPILFGVNFGHGGLGPHLVAGPAIGLKAGCDISATAAGVSASSKCSDAGVTIKSTDFGVTGGGGFTFALGRGTASIDARYTLGLAKIADGSNITNQGFSIGAGFTLPLGSR
jgi:hypothetical protein